MEVYPDQSDEPILRLRGQSGTMGLGVGMNGVLILSVCPTGLRVGMMRVFGPFCRDFFVPWESIAVVREDDPVLADRQASIWQPGGRDAQRFRPCR